MEVDIEYTYTGSATVCAIKMFADRRQGCQRVYFHTKNTNLEGLRRENNGILFGHLEYFMAIYVEYFTAMWYILWPFGNVVVICILFPVW
jgi:hypothetical protein